MPASPPPSLQPSRLKRINLTAAMRAVADPQPIPELTFAELIAAYSAAHPDTEPGQFRKWSEAFGSACAWDVPGEELQRAAEAMKAAGYKAATINRNLSAIGSAYKWAQFTRKIAPRGFHSPTREVKRDEEDMRVVYVSAEEHARIRALAAAFRDRRFCLWVWLLQDTGARPIEIEQRTWRELNVTKLEIVLAREATKTKAARVLHFTPETGRLAERLMPGDSKMDSLVFDSRKKPGQPTDFRAQWDKLRALLGRPELRPYDLRHAAAARLLQAGASLGVASQVLGNSSLVLQRRYGHLATKHLKAAQEAGWHVQQQEANTVFVRGPAANPEAIAAPAPQGLQPLPLATRIA
jgi:integrase